jgi:hypothetical protein
MNKFVKKQIRTEDLERLKKIKKSLGEHLSDRGFPMYNPQQWKELNEEYSKDDIKDALLWFIVDTKVPFPFKDIPMTDVSRLFSALTEKSFRDFILVPEAVDVRVNGVPEKMRALDKFRDYKYGYDKVNEKGEKYGQLIISCIHTYNRISDYFFQHLRYRCDTWGFKNSYHSWTTGEGLRAIFGPIWRLNNTLEKGGSLSFESYAAGIRLGTYVATQFKPPVAMTMYDLYQAKKVIDISCGWGDRLAGFYCSNAEEYYGFDPNEGNYEFYQKQCLEYERLMGNDKAVITEHEDHFECKGLKFVRIYKLPAEDVPYESIPDDIDLVFSSPPYFATELYGKDTDSESKQSWSRYNNHEAWQNDFLHKVIGLCWSRLREGGHMAINIIDANIKGERFKICDPMMDYMATLDKSVLVGMIGMKMSLRPNMVTKAIDVGDSTDLPFVEPVFIARKGGDAIDLVQRAKGRDEIDDLFE